MIANWSGSLSLLLMIGIASESSSGSLLSYRRFQKGLMLGFILGSRRTDDHQGYQGNAYADSPLDAESITHRVSQASESRMSPQFYPISSPFAAALEAASRAQATPSFLASSSSKTTLVSVPTLIPPSLSPPPPSHAPSLLSLLT